MFDFKKGFMEELEKGVREHVWDIKCKVEKNPERFGLNPHIAEIPPEKKVTKKSQEPKSAESPMDSRRGGSLVKNSSGGRFFSGSGNALRSTFESLTTSAPMYSFFGGGMTVHSGGGVTGHESSLSEGDKMRLQVVNRIEERKRSNLRRAVMRRRARERLRSKVKREM